MNDLSETARLVEAPAATAAGLSPSLAAHQSARPAARPAGRDWSTAVSDIRGPLGRFWARQPLTRFIRASLGRRILVSNILGLAGLLLGMLYLSLSHAWLLDAKIEVVRTLSRITAEAIGYRAVNDNRGAMLDPNRLPEGGPARARRDDAFAALELPISPERAAPVLKKLIQPTDLIARIYSPKGTLIVDSETLFGRGEPEPPSTVPVAEDQLRLKNFWTRFHYWLNNKELKVYRELGTANGFLYPEVKKAAEEGVETPILLLDSKGQQIVSMAAPVKRGNKILAVLLLMTRPGEIDATLWEERRLIMQIAAIALLASVISSLLLVRAIAGPMSRLSEAANHVSQNLTARQELPEFADRRDEVGQMGRAFRAMTNALYRRIEASEKFAADVAHELKNPLAAARSTAEALTYARTEQDRTDLVREIQDELKRLNRLINDVSNASRLDAELARQQMQRTNVRTVLDNVSGIFRDLLADDTRKIDLVIEHVENEGQLTVLGNDGRLGQVFTNLIDNALSFSPDGATVTIRARSLPGQVEIAVEDEGPGIPEDRLSTIFERFYSDRPATDAKRGKNSGLGLSISREIVHSHKGEIFAENRPGAGEADSKTLGARFVVRLPQMLTAGGASGRLS
ncbi:MAG: stimulus-sensing domain-containing protein [Hyphomicrobium sp.]